MHSWYFRSPDINEAILRERGAFNLLDQLLSVKTSPLTETASREPDGNDEEKRQSFKAEDSPKVVLYVVISRKCRNF